MSTLRKVLDGVLGVFSLGTESTEFKQWRHISGQTGSRRYSKNNTGRRLVKYRQYKKAKRAGFR